VSHPLSPRSSRRIATWIARYQRRRKRSCVHPSLPLSVERRFVAQLMQRECESNADAPDHYALGDRSAPSWIVIFPRFLIIKIFSALSWQRLRAVSFFFPVFFSVSRRDKIELLLKLLSSIHLQAREIVPWCNVMWLKWLSRWIALWAKWNYLGDFEIFLT